MGFCFGRGDSSFLAVAGLAGLLVSQGVRVTQVLKLPRHGVLAARKKQGKNDTKQ